MLRLRHDQVALPHMVLFASSVLNTFLSGASWHRSASIFYRWRGRTEALLLAARSGYLHGLLARITDPVLWKASIGQRNCLFAICGGVQHCLVPLQLVGAITGTKERCRQLENGPN
jgi:hypothetical protein